MKNEMKYYQISRDEWRFFHGHGDAYTGITADELQQIRGLNDRISLADVSDIYLPLRHLLQMNYEQFQVQQVQKSQFLKIEPHRTPFIIGIAGSVAVGKSTTARLLQLLLSRAYPDRKVQLMTTDGFLYPTATLKQKGILDKKGFPESYDMPRLIHFMNAVKNNVEPVKAPKYSHQIYDIVPGEFDIIDDPDILIVEGINVLQLPSTEQIFVSDFFDFSIYVDAQADLIKKWFLERFDLLLDLAQDDPTNYYYPYAIGDRGSAFKMARRVWRDINLQNLNEYILPTRNRADVILHKTRHHVIDKVFLRKY
ncbi:type I pantothenate kinase [Latilactobacillus graminis]|nr:type I pantothenate kinase [Latilactobacillus graminis]QFP80266.1 type I pantothenate kinase [Latilactobacillus graminis]